MERRERVERMRRDQTGVLAKKKDQAEEIARADWLRLGLEDGLIAASNRNMSLEEIDRIEENHAALTSSGGTALEHIDPGVFRKWIAGDRAEYRRLHPDFDEGAYVAGWMEGVMQFHRRTKN